MNMDGNALLDLMLKAKIASSDPRMAKILDVFTKRGIAVTDALAMLLEISFILKRKEGDTNG